MERHNAQAVNDHLRSDVEHLLSEASAPSPTLTPDFAVHRPQWMDRWPGPDGLTRLQEELRGRTADWRLTALGGDALAVEETMPGSDGARAVSLWFGHQGLLAGVRAYLAQRLEPGAWRAAYVVPMPAGDIAAHSAAEAQPVEREAVERYLRASVAADTNTLRRMRHPDWLHDMPQTGERFPSSEAYIAANENYPGGLPQLRPIGLTGPEDEWVVGPNLHPLRVTGRGANWVGELELVYPAGDPWIELLFMSFRNGLVATERTYWCAPAVPAPASAD